MTNAAILFASALGMAAVYVTQRAVFKADLKDAAHNEYLKGYQDAVLHDEQINRPLDRIIRTATAETKGKTQ